MKELENLRREIDKIDEKMLELFAKRQKVAREIGKIKEKLNIPAVDFMRKKVALDHRLKFGERIGIRKGDIEEIFELLHKKAVEVQEGN